MDKNNEKPLINKDFALIILLFCCIIAIFSSVYAIYTIDSVQNRCDEYYYNKMVELYCIENISLEHSNMEYGEKIYG